MKWFLAKFREFERQDILKMASGIDPLRLFSNISKNANCFKFPRLEGMTPDKLLLLKKI